MTVEKLSMRREARRIRAAASGAATPDMAEQLARNFMAGPLATWEDPRKPVIAGYWPFGTEIDTKPLLYRLLAEGYEVALPVTDAIQPSLQFCKWDRTTVLVPDALGIKAPSSRAPLVSPDIIIAAALAFDRRGHRLGYGTGYYDATFHSLRERKPLTVCMAYAAQEVTAIFVEPQDWPVEWLVTEREARRAVR